jgi:hypothetical protein
VCVGFFCAMRGETAGLSKGRWDGTLPAIEGGAVGNILSTALEGDWEGREDGNTVGSLPDKDGGEVLGTCESIYSKKMSERAG